MLRSWNTPVDIIPIHSLGILERFNKNIKQNSSVSFSIQNTELHNYYKYLNDKNNPIIPETLHYTRGDKVRIQAHITPFIAPGQQRKLLAKTKSTVPNWSSKVKAGSGVVYHRKYYHWQLQKQ
ncbi:hypothetical protein PROFUN_13326 [Planoprotostelium fungivorum]|uniref:Uncharacterized protein n=1 Tax=Planoprotostelium fungivorum TaxID=1890364 RepID=A0A2P6N471_9EUKA|nr:hypothetical protein PROFUN_13326 [Planoprotostelium fungivorum]